MITLFEVLKILRTGKTVELRFNLNCHVYSRHALSLDDGVIKDESFVDGSVTRSTIEEYSRGFYAEAFSKNSVQLLEVY